MANQDFRVKNGLQVGVGGTVLTADVGGKVGINSTSPTATLDIQGTVKSSGTITAPTFAGTATTATNLSDAANITTGTISPDRLSGTYDISISGSVSGDTIAIGTATVSNSITVGPIGSATTFVRADSNGNLIVTGIITASSFSGNASSATYATTADIATYATTAGIATYATTAGIATYATNAGIATYATNAGIATYATSSGIATYATSAGISTYATSAGIATYSTSSGVSTNVIGGIGSITQLSVSGVTTTSRLNVGTGGTVITTTASGLVGIGTTNPRSKLDVHGAITVGGAVSITAERDSENNDVIYFNPLNESRVSIGINTTLNWSSVSGTPDVAFVADKTIAGYPKIAIANPTVTAPFYQLRATYANASAPYGYVRQDIDNGSYAIALNNTSNAFSVGDRTSLDSTRTSNFSSGNEAFVVLMNGSTSLFHSKSKKFETSGVGVTVYGNLNVGTGGTVITTTDAGLVGIGTTRPTSTLDVRGEISIGKVNNSIYGINPSAVISAESTSNNNIIYFTAAEASDGSPATGNRLSIGINTTSNYSGSGAAPDIFFVGEDNMVTGSSSPKIKIANPNYLNDEFYSLEAVYSGAGGVYPPYGYIRNELYDATYSIALNGSFAFSVGDRGSISGTRASNFNSGNEAFVVLLDGSTSLFHNKSKKFETSGVGVTVYGNLNVGTGGTVITTTASGLVGIGTTNPIGTLEVVGSVVADGFDIRNLPRTQLVSYASASDISNSALSIAGVSTYTLVGSFSTTYEYSYSGPAISADGGTIIVGDFSASSLGVEGAVYVYDRVGAGSSIVQVGILTNGISVGGGTPAAFGNSVATSADGKTIAVGAIGDELSGTGNYGLVYVFDRVGVGSLSTFNRVGILTGSFATAANEFGERLIVSGDGKTIIVGAPTDERSGTTGNGLVYVFDRIGNSFRQSNVLSGSLVGNFDRFGESVATSYDGKTIIVGARDDEQTGSGSASGVVYVFDRVGLGTSFNQVGILTGSFASNASDYFGSSVATSVDGKTIIVGAELDETGATNSVGVVYVFDRVGNTFNQVGIFTGSRSNFLDRFGYSVATSADGKTIASYAPSSNFVYIHKREGNSFTQVGIVSYTGDSTEQQKISLTADGKTLILSNPAGIYVYDQVQSTYLYSGSTGNIGIGTSNPTSKLHVQGDVLFTGVTTTSTLNVGTGGTVITTTASGLVGIGTTNPTSKLDVRGNTYLDGTLDITGDIQSVGNINVSDTKTLSFIGGSSVFSNPHITIAALNSSANLYELYAYDQTSGTDYVFEIIKTATDRQFILGNNREFVVAGGSPSGYPADSSQYAFKVKIGAETSLYHNQSEKLTTTGYGVTVTGGLSVSGVTTTSILNVGTGGTVITTTAAGLVGIGTTNPTSKLHVIGDARVGIDTSQGVILTSPNGTKYRLIVSDAGVLSTVLVT